MANTLKNKKLLKPVAPNEQVAPNGDEITLEFTRRIESGAVDGLRQKFPDEMADPDSARTLKRAWFMGVYWHSFQMVNNATPAMMAATRLQGQLEVESQSGAA